MSKETRNPRPETRWIGRVASVALTLLLAPCARVEIKPTLTQPRENIVWPRSGDTPRVRFLANISSPDDLFVRRRWMGLVDFLAGSPDRSFAVPYDVHLTGDELLLVADPGKGCVHFVDMRNHRYREVRALGKAAPDAGGSARAGYELQQPIGVTADENGSIYVSDSLLGNVFVFDRQGEFVRPLARAGTFMRPADLVYSSDAGLLYVADVTAHEVKALRTDGTLVRSIGGRGTPLGKLNFPTHVWAERSGALFVTSAMDAAVTVFDALGQPLASFGQRGDTPGYFSRPKGVATDAAGHIYVADAIFDSFQIFDRRATLLLAVGQAGSGPGELWLPAGIFVDSRNRIFVADQQNHRIAVFQYLGHGSQ